MQFDNGRFMSLKEEFEILRGEPIQVFTGDPMDIPCIETSDAERLCKRPVVSVNMITYNHEHYIRQAIEGVMMQKTDFEFELVIGEDSSTDKTREICFECQKRYPDKIRVLWCDHNLYRNPHPAGANGARNSVHCRGEFMAYCEGDDYWTDPLKLQKQVDAFRAHPSVGICFCGAELTKPNSPEIACEWDGSAFAPGLIKGELAFKNICFGRKEYRWPGGEGFLMTASIMVRRATYLSARQKYDIFHWRLYLGDTTTWLGLASLSDAYYIPDKVSVYRRTGAGVLSSNGYKTNLDACLVRFYYTMKHLGLPFDQALLIWRDLIAIENTNRIKNLGRTEQQEEAKAVLAGAPLGRAFSRLPSRLILVLARFGVLNRVTAAPFVRWLIKTRPYPWMLLDELSK